VPKGSTLLEAARGADIHINASCNGKGACGKCKLILESGQFETDDTPLLSITEKEKKYVLACLTRVKGDITVSIPEESIEKKLKVAGMGEDATKKLKGLVTKIEPMLENYSLELDQPTLEDSVSDLDRLHRGLKKADCDVNRLSVGLKVMRQLAATMREDDWKVTASVLHKKCSSEVLRTSRAGNRSWDDIYCSVCRRYVRRNNSFRYIGT